MPVSAQPQTVMGAEPASALISELSSYLHLYLAGEGRLELGGELLCPKAPSKAWHIIRAQQMWEEKIKRSPVLGAPAYALQEHQLPAEASLSKPRFGRLLREVTPTLLLTATPHCPAAGHDGGKKKKKKNSWFTF